MSETVDTLKGVQDASAAVARLNELVEEAKRAEQDTRRELTTVSNRRTEALRTLQAAMDQHAMSLGLTTVGCGDR